MSRQRFALIAIGFGLGLVATATSSSQLVLGAVVAIGWLALRFVDQRYGGEE